MLWWIPENSTEAKFLQNFGIKVRRKKETLFVCLFVCFIFYYQGFDVVPLQLEIGDYVVSDEIVIERKTVSDLISSFGDGRLFKQCQNMQQHYAVVVLLIEFNGGPFMLQSKVLMLNLSSFHLIPPPSPL